MGYSIPPGDYSLPPMQINVAAELGKTLSSQITNIFKRQASTKSRS